MRRLRASCLCWAFFTAASISSAWADKLTAWIDTTVADPKAILVPIPKTETLFKFGRERIQFTAGDETSLSEAMKKHQNDTLVELGPEALFELIVREAAAGTRFADKININKPYKQGHLNVYTLKSARQIDPIPSCAFVGRDAIIICNSDRLLEMITRFITKDEYLDTVVIKREPDGSVHALKRSELDLQTRDTVDVTLSGGFLGWILAHEIGHAVLHADKIGRGGFLHFSAKGVAESLETQADEFAANQIQHSDILIQMSISSLNEFVAFEYDRFSSNPANAGRFELVNGAKRPSALTLHLHLSEKYPEEFLLYRAASINSIVTRLDAIRDTTGVPQIEFSNLSIERRSGDTAYVIVGVSLVSMFLLLFWHLRGVHDA